VHAYIPFRDDHADAAWRPYYGPARFRYDAERDCSWCPQGQPLRRFVAASGRERVGYRAPPAACAACPVRAACTPSRTGRRSYRSFHAVYLDRARARHPTAAFRRAMRKRSAWVEPLSGEAKQWHGLRQFRLRRLPNVNMEGLFVAAGQNLKRWLAATGWGRRAGPAGALRLPDPAPGATAHP
jgi:hypothetical protein